jgi:hypothetical protein
MVATFSLAELYRVENPVKGELGLLSAFLFMSFSSKEMEYF